MSWCIGSVPNVFMTYVILANVPKDMRTMDKKLAGVLGHLLREDYDGEARAI